MVNSNEFYRFECEYLKNKLVSNKLGIIHDFVRYDKFTPSLSKGIIYGDFPDVTFTFCRTTCEKDGHKRTIQGTGNSNNIYKSQLKAIGECVERYCASVIQPTHMLSFADLERNNIDYISPSKFVKFSVDDYKRVSFRKIEASEVIPWINSYNLRTNKDILIPYQKVSLFDTTSDRMFNHFLSTGLSCSYNKEQAIISGIYECIERDSFIISWRNKLITKEINMDTLPNELRSFISKYDVFTDHRLRLFSISLLDGVNVIMSMLHDNNGELGISVACSANASANRAVKDAVDEIYLSLKHRFNTLYREKKIYREYSDVIDLDDHMDYYAYKENTAPFDYIMNSSELISYSELNEIEFDSRKSEINYLNEIIRSNNDNIYITDVTNEEISSIGLYVVKVMIPSFEDINSNFSNRELGGERLQKFYKGNDEYYHIPHPFP